ncbi:MAG TPA: hypothetical protein VG408_04515 [Actinomycetota bacterium]|nr:hypothetical protein [Actinomycetota bacterium]
MTIERKADPVTDVEQELDKAEDAGEAERLETIEKIHDDLAEELDGSDDAPASGL